ncbi:MAG: MFS transporter [Kluyvera ascorbata]
MGQEKRSLFKISLLSISIINMSGPAVAAAIPLMLAAFPQQSLADIELTVSVTNFGILLLVVLAPFFVRLLGDKKTVMTGLILALVAGCVPVFSGSYEMILFSRFMLGCGIGLFNSLSYSLICQYFDGDERATLLGYQNAVSAIGSALMTLLISQLIAHGWHSVFLIYFLTLLPIILFGLNVPSTRRAATHAVARGQHWRIDWRVPGYALYLFYIFAGYMILIFKLATVVTAVGYSDAAGASLLLTLSTLIAFPGGILFGRVSKMLGHAILPLSLLIIGASLVLLACSTSLAATAVSVLAAGFVFAFVIPYFFSCAAAVSAPDLQTVTSSILLIGINFGVFLHPWVIRMIQLVGGRSDIFFPITAYGVLFITSAVVHSGYLLGRRMITGAKNDE